MTPKEQVIKYYLKAQVKKRATGKEYYEIYQEDRYLGQGKTKKAAWKAASRNIDN